MFHKKYISLLFIIILLLTYFSTPSRGEDNNFLKTIKDSPQVQEEILSLVANNLLKFLSEGEPLSPPAEGSWVLWEKSGVFVTLEKYGQPRGCRGTIYPLCQTLAEELINISIGAATRDQRVEPLKLEELNHIKITVTIVGEVSPVYNYTSEVNPLIHGILVQTLDGQKKGVMLPGEAPTQEKQLLWAKKRADIGPEDGVEIFKFTGVRFSGNVSEILN